MSEYTYKQAEIYPEFDRVAVVDALVELGQPTGLLEWIDLDDKQIHERLTQYAVLLGMEEEDLINMCIFGRVEI